MEGGAMLTARSALVIVAMFGFGCAAGQLARKCEETKFEACGGDVVGRWELVRSCGWLGDCTGPNCGGCQEGDLTLGDFHAVGTIEFRADGTASVQASSTSRATGSFPVRCLARPWGKSIIGEVRDGQTPTCETIGEVVTDSWALGDPVTPEMAAKQARMDVSSASCEEVGGQCSCNLDVRAGFLSGILWKVDDGDVFVKTDDEKWGRGDPYCVSDGVLIIKHTANLMMTYSVFKKVK